MEKLIHSEICSCPLWHSEYAHALLLHGFIELKAKCPLSMRLPTGTHQFPSDSAAKTIPPKTRFLAKSLQKTSFLTENYQHLSASNIQTQLWFTDIAENHVKLPILPATCSWRFPRLPWASLIPLLISRWSELLSGQWLNVESQLSKVPRKREALWDEFLLHLWSLLWSLLPIILFFFFFCILLWHVLT